MEIDTNKFQFIGVILLVKTGIKNRYKFSLKIASKIENYLIELHILEAKSLKAFYLLTFFRFNLLIL